MPLSTEPGHEARFLFEVIGTSYETRVLNFTLYESLSSPFELNISLVSEDEIKFEEVVGKEALLTLLGEENDRYCHGIINKFIFTGSRDRFYLYQARVVPSLWFLSLERDCRIFQDKNVEEIVKQVLQEGGITSDRFDFRLQNPTPKRDYCVQYRETDLNFISRLLEEEGIFYFFEHSNNKHLLVFGDSTVPYQTIPGTSEVTYNPKPAGMIPEEEYVFGFNFSKKVYSGKITQRDFNFEKPSLDLKSEEKDQYYDKLEIYDYPGRYLDQDRGKKLTQIRLQESMTFREKAEGQSSCIRFTPGFKFKLKDHEWDTLNQEYLLVEVIHQGTQPQSLEERGGEGRGTTYSNDFVGIPASVIFRPERKTPKPIVEGMQTAWVTGPKGEEIYTDEYGRVKVQFHWDREGKKDEKTTCWLRVAQFWAGKGWGTVFLPRVGDEVLVDFLEGDPDKPIVVGSFYNEEAKPLYKLPDEKTKSTIKTKSYPNDPGFNEIRFEDKKGKEEIFIHAEKDMNEVIKNNRTISVGGDHTETIQGDTKITIKKGTFEHDVAANTAKYHVMSDIIEDYDATQKTTVAKEISIISEGSSIHITAATEIQLQVGESKLLMKEDGSIELSGVNLAFHGKESVNTSGRSITSKADQDHNIQGMIVISEGTASNTVKGGMVMLNP
jgi:type VI secretion system secreted protein VgrG